MNSASINDRVERIKHDEEEINRLVEEYKPFIASCAEKATGRYVRYGEDDELSIALMAFVEAIKSYDINKGSFLSFAKDVIRKRLIDYHRKEKKHSNIVSINGYFMEGEDDERDLGINESMEDYSAREANEYRRLELQELKKELREWDITFSQLADASPKHERTRRLYADIIRYLMSRPELVKHIMSKKYLPVSEIEKGTGLPRKKIERARKYIIAVLIINTGDYQYIRDFVDWG